MIFHQISTERGCQSYLIGCKETCAAVVVDPEISQIDRYLAIASKEGLRVHFLVDTHTHADHFSASLNFGQQIDVPVVMHRKSAAPFVDMRVDDGEILSVGNLKLRFMHTPGHTEDSMCVVLADRVLTGDTLLIGGTGRTDLPTGNPEDLHQSLYQGLLTLSPELKVYPGHDYKKLGHTTLQKEIAENPRLKVPDRNQFVDMMESLNMNLPTHLTEALRTNLSGGKTVDQLLAEANSKVSFMSMEEVNRRQLQQQFGSSNTGCQGRRRLHRCPHSWGDPYPPGSTGAQGQSGSARPYAQDCDLLRVWKNIHTGCRNAARKWVLAAQLLWMGVWRHGGRQGLK